MRSLIISILMSAVFTIGFIWFLHTIYKVSIAKEVERTNLFRTSKNVYCPSSTKMIKGDGVFTQDYTSTLSLRKVEVSSVENGYIYTSTGEAFGMFKCIVRGK